MGGKLLIGVLIIVVALVIVGAVLAGPYLKAPPESKQALEARYDDFRKTADSLKNRPKADMESLLSIVTELEPTLKSSGPDKSLMMGVDPLQDAPCPNFEMDAILKAEPRIATVLAKDAEVQAILSDGFTVQLDPWSTDYPNFYFIRAFVYAQLAAAVLDAKKGDTDQAVQRLQWATQLTDGFSQTPFLLYCLNGTRLEDTIDRTILALATKFSEEQLTQIRQGIAARPEALETMIQAMQVENVVVADLYKYPSKEMFSSSIHWFGWIWPVAKHTSAVKDARWNYLSFSTRIYDYYEGWFKSEKKEYPNPPDQLIKNLRYNVAAAIACPNYSNLLDKARMADLHKQPMLEALDAELAMRKKEVREKIVVPYDENYNIVIEGEHGCIVEK